MRRALPRARLGAAGAARDRVPHHRQGRAAACGLSESHLSTALGDRASDRYLRDEHIDAILRLATDAERAEYWTARLTAYGLKPAAVAPRTPVERLARLEELAIRRFGAAGAELVDKERSRP